MEEKKRTRERDLETILSICVVLVGLFLIGKQHHKYYLTVAVILGLIGMFSKYLTAKISWAWWKLSEMMGAVMSRVILSVVFFVFLLPVALLARLFSSKDNLQLSKTTGDTYYAERDHIYQAQDLENGW